MESKGQEDIASIVERYRITMKLKPWEEWAEQISGILLKAHGLKNTGHRRTGRTQLGILRAIAMCERQGATVLSIEAQPKANLDYCIDMAKKSLAALGFDRRIRVTEDLPGCSRGELSVLFTDHHIPSRVAS